MLYHVAARSKSVAQTAVSHEFTQTEHAADMAAIAVRLAEAAGMDVKAARQNLTASNAQRYADEAARGSVTVAQLAQSADAFDASVGDQIKKLKLSPIAKLKGMSLEGKTPDEIAVAALTPLSSTSVPQLVTGMGAALYAAEGRANPNSATRRAARQLIEKERAASRSYLGRGEYFDS